MSKMARIRDILNDFLLLSLYDEDEESVQLILNESASEKVLKEYEGRITRAVPCELRELLAMSDGLDLFGLDIMPIDRQDLFETQGLLSFHDWGNGDFDCVVLAGSCVGPEGSIVFMNHSPEVTVPIAESLEKWLLRVVEEITDKGTLLHPSDYRVRHEQGLYAGVLEALSNRDCELNR